MTGHSPNPDLDRRLRRTALACAGLVAGMVGLAYAAVPLYDLFCRMTGFDGTPIVRTVTPAGPALDRTMAVRFDANVAPGLNWRFSAETPEVTVRVGETQTVLYRIRNEGPVATTGVAAYNVQPSVAGAYFVKIQCFCFTEQTLQPGETVESAVVFYVDPAVAQDPNMADTRSITLSYTYFPARNAKTAEAPAAGAMAANPGARAAEAPAAATGAVAASPRAKTAETPAAASAAAPAGPGARVAEGSAAATPVPAAKPQQAR